MPRDNLTAQLMRIMPALLLLAATGHAADPSKLETILGEENLWETSAGTFVTGRNAHFFVWLSDKQDAVRYPGYLNSPVMTFLGNKCWETLIKFENDKVSDITISLYTRGDAGGIDESKFQTLQAAIDKNIQDWVADNGVIRPATKLANGMKVETKAWVKNNSLALELKWSATENIRIKNPLNPNGFNRIKFRAEYIQLSARKFNPKNDPRKVSAPSAIKGAERASARDIKQNVKRAADGYVHIDNLPMVDQGEKGYCAVATTERILSYYGKDFDQHALAQVANTSADGGTDPDRMLDVLRKLGVKLGVKVKIHYGLDVQKFIRFIEDYNKAARRGKLGVIVISQLIDVGEVYYEMDPAVLKAVKCDKYKAAMKSFNADIMSHVDAGIPLAWSVILGKIEEKPKLPQAFGGHMRIIFGYNKAKNEIMYTDSWGAGHERKTMSLEDAWTITLGLYSFDPRN